MKILIVYFATILCFSAIAQEQIVKGVVFEDINANGVFDKGDKCLKGVAVSNMQDVVLTNKKGEYKLPYVGNEFIFVTKPVAYQFANDSLGYGLFYQAAYKDDNREINFPLHKKEENVTIRTLLVGDPQMADKARLDYYRDGSVNHMMKQEADFFMVLGDIADDDPELLQQEKELMAQLGMDGYHVAGNHDANYESQDIKTHFKTFKDTYGPDYYSYNYAKAHFVVLNNVNYFGWNHEGNKRGSYFGGVDEQQLKWLKNDLALVPTDQLIVIGTHIPLLEDYMDTVSIATIHKLLEPFENILAVSGHLHGVKAYANDVSTRWNGKGNYESLVVGATCGSWWTGPYTEEELPYATCMDGAPKGYFILELDGVKYNYRFIPEYYPEDYQMRIPLPNKTITQNDNERTEVIVNWFVGKNTDRVFMKVNDGEWEQMQNYEGESPFIKSTLSQRSNIDNWTPGISETTHLWKGYLPSGLLKGYHSIRVKAINSNGQIFNANKVFEIKK